MLLGYSLLVNFCLFLGTFAVDQFTILYLYIGAVFLSFTSGTVVTCLTSLASKTTNENKGKVLGIFRASGQLGRCLGPSVVCLMYWIYGSYVVYVIASCWMVLLFALAYIGIESIKEKKK